MDNLIDSIDIRPKEKQEEKPINVKRTTKDILKEFRKELAKARQNAKEHDIVIDADFYQESEKINKVIEKSTTTETSSRGILERTFINNS